MRGGESDAVSTFITEHRLHVACPVDLGAVRDLYWVEPASLSDSLLGFAIRHEEQALIGYNQRLCLPEQRMAVAHELSHVLCRDPGAIFLCRRSAWLQQRYELIAQRNAARLLICRSRLLELANDGLTVPELAAALMLIPFEPLRERVLAGYTVAAIAGKFRVPQALVETRVEMAGERLLPRTVLPRPLLKVEGRT